MTGHTPTRWIAAARRAAGIVLLGLIVATPAAAQEATAPPVPALLRPDALLSVGRLVDPDLDPPLVLGSEKEGTIRDRSLTVFDRVYVPLVVDGRPLEPGDRLRTFRLRHRVVDPVTGAPAGRVLDPTGVVVVDSLAREVAVARIEHAFGAVQVGDGIEAVSPADTMALESVPARSGVEGYVLGFQAAKELHPTYDVAFLRLGSPAALAPGATVHVVAPRETLDGREGPQVLVGRAMVVRVHGDVAAAMLYRVRRSDLRSGLIFRSVDPDR